MTKRMYIVVAAPKNADFEKIKDGRGDGRAFVHCYATEKEAKRSLDSLRQAMPEKDISFWASVDMFISDIFCANNE